MSNVPNFEFGDGEFDSQNYKSCFARSVVVNSDYRVKNIIANSDLIKNVQSNQGQVKGAIPKMSDTQGQSFVRMRKNIRSNSMDASCRYSLNLNESRRSSFCSSITEMPVENIANQSRIETLEWQLKEVQKSRDMYKAVMKQVVIFLEKAQHNLEILSSRRSRRNSATPRSKSDHQIKMENSRGYNDTSTPIKSSNGSVDLSSPGSAVNFFWKHKKEDPSPEETPPDKLAQEAFRLLRTAQSLLNTREPDLARVQTPEKEDDIEFLAQIAKEFPSTPPTPTVIEQRPQRATSFSLSPKLILPGNDVKIATAFNRKLSLQLSEVRRNSKVYRSTESARDSVAESEPEFLQDSNNTLMNGKMKSEKSSSPANGSISSVEDESGFSSMNSFQEVGLPSIQPIPTDEVTTKAALLRSMIHNNTDYSSLNLSVTNSPSSESTILANDSSSNKSNVSQKNIDEIKLWQRPTSSSTPQHKRYYSMPVDDSANQSLKVLWV